MVLSSYLLYSYRCQMIRKCDKSVDANYRFGMCRVFSICTKTLACGTSLVHHLNWTNENGTFFYIFPTKSTFWVYKELSHWDIYRQIKLLNSHPFSFVINKTLGFISIQSISSFMKLTIKYYLDNFWWEKWSFGMKCQMSNYQIIKIRIIASNAISSKICWFNLNWTLIHCVMGWAE